MGDKGAVYHLAKAQVDTFVNQSKIYNYVVNHFQTLVNLN